VSPYIFDLPGCDKRFIFVLQNNDIPIMTEKFKKIDRQFVLSDSSVNVYGFRLLTSGYQLDAYGKNPIGYYMHQREDGIAVKWENLRVEGDNIVATPVINLSNARGEQTCAEVENGFLNAASVGHIVVLEYSTEPELMLPGQTGPTITKWYNKECSLVDIPGNNNALTALYDAHENQINLVDIGAAPATLLGNNQLVAIKEISNVLQLADGADVTGVITAIQDLHAKTTLLTTVNTALQTDNAQLQQQLQDLKEATLKAEVSLLLDRALEDKKITVNLRNRLAADYAGNATALKELLAAMPVYQSVNERLQQARESAQLQWTWDDYEKNDPTGNKLKELRASDPVRYKELFDEKFAA
jgi:hypothetical protein